MFNTPAGVVTLDVGKIGTPDLKLDVVTPGVRGGYFARRSREIYSGGGRGRGPPRDKFCRNSNACFRARNWRN